MESRIGEEPEDGLALLFGDGSGAPATPAPVSAAPATPVPATPQAAALAPDLAAPPAPGPGSLPADSAPLTRRERRAAEEGGVLRPSDGSLAPEPAFVVGPAEPASLDGSPAAAPLTVAPSAFDPVAAAFPPPTALPAPGMPTPGAPVSAPPAESWAPPVSAPAWAPPAATPFAAPPPSALEQPFSGVEPAWAPPGGSDLGWAPPSGAPAAVPSLPEPWPMPPPSGAIPLYPDLAPPVDESMPVAVDLAPPAGVVEAIDDGSDVDGEPYPSSLLAQPAPAAVPAAAPTAYPVEFPAATLGEASTGTAWTLASDSAIDDEPLVVPEPLVAPDPYAAAPPLGAAPSFAPPEPRVGLEAMPAPVAPSARPTGPLLPSSAPPPPPIEEIERSTAGERIGLVVALLVPVVGLVVAITNAARSRRRRGWVTGLVRSSVALSIVVALLGAAGGAFLWLQRAQALRHDEYRLASTSFCAAVVANPALIEGPVFGWPAPAGAIPESIAAMQDYAAQWAMLVATAPEPIRAEVITFAGTASRIAGSVAVARTIDDATNQAIMGSLATRSALPAWHTEYCTSG